MYEYYYSTPTLSYFDQFWIVGLTAVVGFILGVVLCFTFFHKKNEGRFSGIKEKVYNYMNFNRFYAEDLLRLVYIIATCVVTLTGMMNIILGSFLTGVALLVGVNLSMRIGFELVMMFIIMCRKTVSSERKLARIADYYDDGFDEFGGADEPLDEEYMDEEEMEESMDGFVAKKAADYFGEFNFQCGGECSSCGVEGCGGPAEEEDEDIVRF